MILPTLQSRRDPVVQVPTGWTIIAELLLFISGLTVSHN